MSAFYHNTSSKKSSAWLFCCEPPYGLHHRLNTNVELCKSLKNLLDNEEVMAKLDPETRCAFSSDFLSTHIVCVVVF